MRYEHERASEHSVALRNCGRIDPRDLNAYIAECHGYSGLERALGLGREGVIAKLRSSGLQGRGGAGYLAAAKWQICHDAEGEEKYAVCNAVDADPRARTARLLLGGDPYSVLEGLLIGAYAVGAAHCFVCINTEYTGELTVLQEALEALRERGLLGSGILESEFSCDIAIKEIAGSLVAGEETALLQALEGKQLLPYRRSVYPAVRGLYGKPTLVNSAETLANVSAIFQEHPAVTGPGGLAGGGCGTKVVTVFGGVSGSCTLEVPLGTTIAAVTEAAEGVPLSDLDLKAVQFGGPTGVFLAGSGLQTPITYEALQEAGAAMGSASVEMFGGDRCAVEMARDVMLYLERQSCGKCVSCREVTYQLADMLSDIAESKGEAKDMEMIGELCEFMRSNSICGLGKSAAAPVLSSIELFAGDYDAHIKDKRCPSTST
ncbi:MAG: hypothetical protein A2133_08200 [Actinobacteria bacterium RBG_16_64_13]|nr:MAG: hypothetical protein A2133_08200 [Actinobacteria bacterium RBG_16_64_13]